jgi:hypothetical protein
LFWIHRWVPLATEAPAYDLEGPTPSYAPHRLKSDENEP